MSKSLNLLAAACWQTQKNRIIKKQANIKNLKPLESKYSVE